jgi:hypothetical protein
MGLGAGILAARHWKPKSGGKRFLSRFASKSDDRNESSGTYCAVPEGADICFPDQEKG